MCKLPILFPKELFSTRGKIRRNCPRCLEKVMKHYNIRIIYQIASKNRCYREADNSKNRKNDIEKEDYAKILYDSDGYCHYCNQQFNHRNLGLDRMDSSIGHVKGNVVPCCYNCNTKKGTMDYNKFKMIISESNPLSPKFDLDEFTEDLTILKAFLDEKFSRTEDDIIKEFETLEDINDQNNLPEDIIIESELLEIENDDKVPSNDIIEEFKILEDINDQNNHSEDTVPESELLEIEDDLDKLD